MVRFNDKTQISSLASNDIMPITDMSDTTDDRKVTVEQLSQFTVDNIPTLSGGKTLTDNNLTNALKNNYDTAYTNQDLTKYDENISYPKGYWVTGFIEDKKVIKESMVDDNLGNLLTDETKWKDVIDNSRASINLDNLSEEGETHFLNKTQITNCILSAPNGVATYSGNTITVKGGLKYLTGNGRNADETLKNVEHTLPQDKQINFTTLGGIGYIYIINGNPNLCPFSECYRIDNDPSAESPTGKSDNNQIWFDLWNNKVYYSAYGSTDWIITNDLCIVGMIFESSLGVIGAVRLELPVDFLKRNDSSEISGFGIASDIFADLGTPVSGQKYTAVTNGTFVCQLLSSAEKQFANMEVYTKSNALKYNMTSQPTSTGYNATLIANVKQGESIILRFNTNKIDVGVYFKFYYAEGIIR